MAIRFPHELECLIAHLKKLPGVGTKTAERFAFAFMQWPEGQLQNLSSTLSLLKQKIIPCSTCGCLTQEDSCSFCLNPRRDHSVLCILASPRDVYAIEETLCFQGLYHVLPHLLSPLDGKHSDSLPTQLLQERIQAQGVKEVIMGLDSTLEGDATALYLKEQLQPLGVLISRFAFGLPLGSSLEFVDGGTLTQALAGRQLLCKSLN